MAKVPVWANTMVVPRYRPERTDMRNDQGLHAGLCRRRHVVADECQSTHRRSRRTRAGPVSSCTRPGDGADEGREVRVEADDAVRRDVHSYSRSYRESNRSRQAGRYPQRRARAACSCDSKVNPMTRVCPNEIRDWRVGHAGAGEIRGEGDGETVETATGKTLNHLAYGRGTGRRAPMRTIGAR